MESTTGILGGIVGIALGIFAIVVAIFWLVLPLIIYFKLSKIERHLAKLNADNDAWRASEVRRPV